MRQFALTTKCPQCGHHNPLIGGKGDGADKIIEKRDPDAIMLQRVRTMNATQMFRYLALLLLISISAPVSADQFYLTAGAECNQSKSELVVWFRGAFNEAGETAIANLGKDGLDPRKLVSFTQHADGKYSIDTKTQTRICVLGKSKYTVNISPLMAPRFHPEGFCATRIGAKATVRLNKKIVVSDGVDACTETGRVTTKIIVKPNQVPVYEKVSAAKFYGG